ncbi:hypothetical protein JHK86_043874 [Glycine max]|nr:hypothetical protein JHK86_043874 [Glycine max]
MPFKPNATVWGAILGACRIHHDSILAETATKKLMELNVEDFGGYVLLANIYAEFGELENVADMRKLMNVKGIRKSPIHLLCGIDDSHSMQLTHLTCNLVWVEITDVPADTKDKDEILESEFFDTRQAFGPQAQCTRPVLHLGLFAFFSDYHSSDDCQQMNEAYNVVDHDIFVERQSEKWDAPEEDGGVSCGVAGREGHRGRLEFFWRKKTKKHNNHTPENGMLQRRTFTVSSWCCQRKST